MRPVFLLDQDGPLAGFDQFFWDRCHDRGYTFDIEHISEQRSYWLSDHIPDEQEREEATIMKNTAGWFLDLPVTPGAKENVGALMEVADVWVCTRPNANPTVRDDKVTWLQEHFPELAGKCIATPNKGLVQGAILIDDWPQEEWLAYATWAPVIFPTPANKNHLPEAPRWTWGDYPEELVEWARKTGQADPAGS